MRNFNVFCDCHVRLCEKFFRHERSRDEQNVKCDRTVCLIEKVCADNLASATKVAYMQRTQNQEIGK